MALNVSLANGSSSQIGGTYVEGNIVVYSCKNGQLSMSTISLCENTGNWNVSVASLPSCLQCKLIRI